MCMCEHFCSSVCVCLHKCVLCIQVCTLHCMCGCVSAHRGQERVSDPPKMVLLDLGVTKSERLELASCPPEDRDGLINPE